jgi:hypothetical protein
MQAFLIKKRAVCQSSVWVTDFFDIITLLNSLGPVFVSKAILFEIRRYKRNGYARKDLSGKKIKQEMKMGNTVIQAFVRLIIIGFLGGCASTVLVQVPPKINLSQYESIGIIDFASNAEGDIKESVTQKFIQSIQQSQPGTAILELGNERSILASAGSNQLDPETVRLIGEQNGVDVIMTGNLSISKSKPRFNIANGLTSIGANVEVEASLNTKMLDTKRGATIWVATPSGKWTLASISGNSEGIQRVGLSDLETKYSAIISQLVYAATEDFRPRYERHPKD